MKYSSLNLNTDNEVFDEFIKIAENKIFKVVQEGDDSNVKDMKSLYDVSKEDKTGKELIEKAHPEKGETIESYLTDGGLVENQNQQQEIDIAIALKNPNTKVYKKTMAAKELADELIIIAEEMDVRGNEDLAAYADGILYRLDKTVLAGVGEIAEEALTGVAAKQIAKAVAPKAVAGVAGVAGAGASTSWIGSAGLLGAATPWVAAGVGVAAIAGALCLIVHFADPINFGVDTNLSSLLTCIDKYKQEQNKDSDMASRVLESLNETCSGIYKTRESYKKLMDALTSKLKTLTKVPETKDQLLNTSSKNIVQASNDKQVQETVEKINKNNEMYNSYIKQMNEKLMSISKYLESYFKATQDIAHSESGERGVLDTLSDVGKRWWGKVSNSLAEELVIALNVFIKSLLDDMNFRTQELHQLVSMMTSKVQADISQNFSSETSKVDPSQTSTTVPA